VKVGLYGSLSVTSADEIVQITPPQERTLLASLAVEAGSPVPVEVIAANVWGDEPPRTWPGSLWTLTGRLRKRLRSEAPLIVTEPSAYRLAINPDDVDLLRFDSLLRAGLTAVRSGRRRQARDLLAEAEQLRRGAPLADIPSARLREAHQHYLEEKFLTIRELRAEADLWLSPPRTASALIPDLRALADTHPHRETARYLLMLALFRAGRQADAQEEFRRAWAYSRDEHGVPPGHDLRDLHDRITAGQESLLRQEN
jgi:DNA-binding SARP family transcriptional activator